MSSFYGNASIGSGLPQVNNNDNGKVLIARDGEWELDFPSADGLPVVTENDNGKALVVDNGQWDVKNVSGDLQNLVDGSSVGSVRGINARSEDANYTMGVSAFAEGAGTTASGVQSHAEGGGTTASAQGAHAEGAGTTASGVQSHAEGGGSRATGRQSHAEGSGTLASGGSSHAEGGGTTTSGSCSHAEGGGTVASGDYSHAEGANTTANHLAQHVFGQHNIADSSNADASERGNYVEIVGNGTGENMKSNARTLDWNGNEVLAGKLTVGAAPTNNMDVATKQYVDNKIIEAIPAPTSPATGSFLVYNGTAWVAQTLQTWQGGNY